MSRSTRVLFLTLSMSIASTAFSMTTRAEVIERVVAIVNEEAIWMSELRRRATPFLPRVMSAPSQEQRMQLIRQLYQELVTRLIDEVLIRQAAERMQVRVSQSDLERAISNVQQQNDLTDEEFWQAVRSQGYTEAQYRTDLRQQLLRLKVINQRIRGRVNITEEDVRREYDQRLRLENRQYRFRASHLFLALPANANATEVAAIRNRIESITEGLSPESFEDAAIEHGGGSLGWLTQGDLPSELEDALMALSQGEISAPVRGPSGFHVFLLHERERGDSDAPSFDAVKEEIYRRMLDEAMAEQEQLFLEELRSSALIKRRY